MTRTSAAGIDNPAQIFLQALTLHQRGRLPEAEALYRVVLAQNADRVEAVYNLGLVRLLLGDFEDAVGLLNRTLAQKPDLAEAHNALAVALRALKRHDKAIAHFEKAVAIRPDFAEAYNNFGATLQPLSRYDEALAHFDKALEIRPDLAEAHHGRGIVLRTLGRLDEAQHAFENAADLAPHKAEFYRSLAEGKRFTDCDPHRLSIEALAQNMASLPEAEQIHLHFALGKVYTDLGRHEESFRHLIAGNALKRKEIDYVESGVWERLERTRALFSAEVMRERRGLGHPSRTPVFIFGMPRSGTTLVEQILASHPKVYGAGELSDFETAVAGLGGPNGAPADVGGEELHQIGARYVERVQAIAPSAERVTDKMPGNFWYAGLINLALPNAYLIHTRRDPVDTCLSCFSILFGGEQPFAYDLGELGRYYRVYAAIMQHWRDVLPRGTILEVQYEDLVSDFECQARRIVAHCGLAWDDACLEFYKTERPIRTASAVQVRRPIHHGSVGRERLFKKETLQPLLDALNEISG